MRSSVIDGVIFDFDGTLTKPRAIDFAAIRAEIGCPEGAMILDYLRSIPSEVARVRAEEILLHHERVAAEASQPGVGAEELVRELREKGYRVGILTRNTTDSVFRALSNFSRLSPSDFDAIVSRDDPVSVKPHGDSVRYTAGRMGVLPERTLMIGDYRDDVVAGHEAGSWTCFLSHESRESRALPHDDAAQHPIPGLPADVRPDYCVSALLEVRSLLQRHCRLPQGKVPNSILESLLSSPISSAHRGDVLTGPGIGIDAALIDTDSSSSLAITCDPITFATDNPADLLVTVNANDLACSGATPRWMTLTALFPPETTHHDVDAVVRGVDRAAAAAGIALVAGHTEITDSVTRPVLTATVLGSLFTPSPIPHPNPSIQPGDCLVLTKSAGIEGTFILASRYRDVLIHRGVPAQVVDAAAKWHSKLSIRTEAAAAWNHPDTRAVHDVTEGGVATALREMAHAQRVRFLVERDHIPVAEETRIVTTALAIDPLGLIGSGSLLVILAKTAVADFQSHCTDHGIQATEIGTVARVGEYGLDGSVPAFSADELARFSSAAT